MCLFQGVLPPRSERLSLEEIYDQQTGKPSPEVLKQHFVQEGRISEDAALKIIKEG